jgi:hypothetical protein
VQVRKPCSSDDLIVCRSGLAIPGVGGRWL